MLMIHTFASYYCKLGGRMHFRYYHFICSILEKEIYASILEDFLECREKIAISNDISIPSEIIWKVVKMVLYDNPRIFYVSIRDSCVTRTSLSIILEPKYTFPLSSIVELNDWLNEQIGEICAPVVSSDDDFAKEIFIHNYMIQNIKYSKANVSQIANAYTIIGALLENYCVCAGVSLTFKLLMDFLDVPCIVAFGETINQSNNNGPHAWNIVNIEGDYYQLDVTWDLLEDQNSRIIKYDYFNLTSYEMYKSRIPEYKYPDCQHVRHNYFLYTRSIALSIDDLHNCIESKAIVGEECIYVKYYEGSITNDEIHQLLKSISSIGNYSFWHNKEMRTVLIRRVNVR